ncbi:phospholipase D-like domain-containing protein [Salisediminibacterium selenitireducens]|uniref:Phospholipase D/Transphosphatidylase n=1 Tax=Bacillus selenitireducens (strain ATCC 700615 / DSM 15326 / MLS10) TaxID=439292 RepID=D6XZ64_BACIE|nr:phospholipase D family protein [Salisediminibacterium selenitireducens]ADI00349.1 phospholipase D/Transphosphatidylase [[Bacillus] selenitireducens MLS10]
MKGYYRKNVKRAAWVVVVFIISFGSLLFDAADPPSGEAVSLFEGTSDDILIEARILEDAQDAADTRLSLIQEAESEIQIVYHTFHEGDYMESFFRELFRAADRGVEVTLVVDGMLHQMNGSMRGLPALIGRHERMTLHVYEPPEASSPMRWNNRLHDKLMIVDERYVMNGGRNIGDKYMTADDAVPVRDRDVLVRATGDAAGEAPFIKEASAYVDTLLDGERTFAYEGESSVYVNRQAERLKERLDKESEGDGVKRGDPLSEWIPVEEVAFVANPLEGIQREPVVWATIAGLLNEARSSIVVQTPYLIPNEAMMAKIDIHHVSDKEVSVVTNSVYSSPNYPAFSAYLYDRDTWLEADVELNEYRGTGSIHAKSVLIDDEVSVIGSFNADPRSAYLNTESVLVIKGEAFADEHRRHLESLKDESLMAPEGDDWLDAETPVMKKRIMERLSPWSNRFKHLL